jgi:hypothetical protein
MHELRALDLENRVRVVLINGTRGAWWGHGLHTLTQAHQRNCCRRSGCGSWCCPRTKGGCWPMRKSMPTSSRATGPYTGACRPCASHPPHTVTADAHALDQLRPSQWLFGSDSRVACCRDYLLYLLARDRVVVRRDFAEVRLHLALSLASRSIDAH